MSAVEPTPTPPAAPAASAPRHARHGWCWHFSLGLLALLLGALAALAGLLSWVWHSQEGSTWALEQLPGVQASGLSGALGDEEGHLQQLRVSLPTGELRLQGLQWRQARWQGPQHWGVPWLGLHLGTLHAEQLHWQAQPKEKNSPADPTPPHLPDSLRLPVQLQIDRLSLAQMQLNGQPLLHAFSTRLELGADGGASHRLSQLQLGSAYAQVQAQLSVAADAPFLLTAQGELASPAGAARPWQAKLQARGPLAQLQLQAQLSGAARQAGQAPLAATLQASVQPLQAWPLTRLQASVQALDLQALHPSAPHTRLSGQAQLETPTRNTPARLDIQLDNPAAGPWNQALLPLRQLHAKLGVTPEQPDRWTLSELRADWGSVQQPGGRLEAQGSYQSNATRSERTPSNKSSPPGLVQVRWQFSHWRPAALDTRLADMTLDGQLKLQASALPAPSAWAQAGTPDWSHWLAQLQLELSGSLAGSRSPSVQLKLDSQLSAQRVVLQQLQAQAGAAQLQAQGEWQLLAGQHQLRLQLDSQALDPSVWLPGDADAPWRHGRNELNLHLSGQARLAEATRQQQAPSEWLQAVVGQLQLQLAPSWLSDVPMQAELKLSHQGEQQSAQAELNLAGNHLQLSGQHPASTDQPWRLRLDAPHLPALAPLLAWWPEQQRQLQSYWPSSAQLQLQAQLDSLEPAQHWTLQAQIHDWQASQLQLQSLALQAHGGTQPSDPAHAQLDLAGVKLSGWPLSQAQLRLDGSLAQHQISAAFQAPLRPPAWLEPWLASHPMTGTRAQLTAQGGWLALSPQEPALGRWQAHIQTLSLGALNDPSSPDWLHAQGLQLQLDTNAQGQPQTMVLAPGRLSLPSTSLQWSLARWQADPQGGKNAQIEFQAQLEPVMLAPLLAKQQPDMGWSGDLRMGADILYRHTDRTEVDIVFSRRGGDLSVSDPGEVLSGIKQQPLGMSEVRLGIAAREGRWDFTQAVAGRQLGEIVSALSVESTPQQLWPQAQDKLSGVAQLRVAALSAWGAWVPAGWRLEGTLAAQAQFAGTLADPQITGQMLGEQLGLSQVLQGIHWHDGRLKVLFEGENARIEQAELHGGPGKLTLTGQARLGQHPQASVNLLAQQFQVLGRVDRKLITSGQAQLAWQDQALDLRGQLKVDEGLFDFSKGNAPSLDDDVQVLETLPSTSRNANGRSGQSTRMQIGLDLGSHLELRGRGLATQLRGNLQINTQADGKPLLLGQVRAERGTYAAYGQKLEIDRGLITFTGPAEDPRLDIFAIRSGLDIKVGVSVTGTALNPRVRLASDSDMTDTERLSWLLLGRAPDTLGQADTELLQRAALALLMGEGEGPTDALLHGLGLTDLSVRQETDGDVRATVVSVGKQLSRRWYVGYERSVNTTTGTWQLIYRTAQRLTVRLQSGEQKALDLIWTWRWN